MTDIEVGEGGIEGKDKERERGVKKVGGQFYFPPNSFTLSN